MDRPRDAEAHLAILAEDPNDLVSRFALADFYVFEGREDEATDLLEDLVQHADVFALAQMRLAGLVHAAGRLENAYTMLKEVITREPMNPAPYVLQTRWLLLDGKFEESLVSAQKAVELGPDIPDGHHLIGEARLASGNLRGAAEAFSESLRLAPASNLARIRLVGLYLQRGDAETAVAFASDAVQREPNNAAARLGLARALTARGEPEQAEPEVRLVLDTLPDLPEAHSLLGSILGAQHKLSDARLSFERALELDGESLEAFSGLVSVDISENRVDRARARIGQRLNAPSSRNPPLLAFAARTYATAGDSATAESALTEAIQRDPPYLPAYQLLATMYFAQGRLDEASERYQELVERVPTSIPGQTMTAGILTLQEQTEEATEQYEAVLRIDPQAVVAANNLAYTMAEEGRDLDRARELAQTARAQAPDSPDTGDTLGWVYYKQGLLSLAIPLLQKTVAKRPDEPIYHYHLGMALLEAGDERALAELQRARWTRAFSCQRQRATTADRALSSLAEVAFGLCQLERRTGRVRGLTTQAPSYRGCRFRPVRAIPKFTSVTGR